MLCFNCFLLRGLQHRAVIRRHRSGVTGAQIMLLFISPHIQREDVIKMAALGAIAENAGVMSVPFGYKLIIANCQNTGWVSPPQPHTHSASQARQIKKEERKKLEILSKLQQCLNSEVEPEIGSGWARDGLTVKRERELARPVHSGAQRGDLRISVECVWNEEVCDQSAAQPGREGRLELI